MTRRRKTSWAFTTIELLVATAVLLISMAAVIEIFNISSDAAGKTASHTKVMESASGFRQRVTEQLDMMKPGLLIIECPTPTPPRRETAGMPTDQNVEHIPFLRLRHDRLVFLTGGSAEEYQSVTDPTRATPLGTDPTIGPATSSEALVYLGPGIPLVDNDDEHRPRPLATSDSLSVSLTAAEWVFLHRSILLLTEDPGTLSSGWDPPNMDVAFVNGLFDGQDLGAMQGAGFPLLSCRMDAVHSTTGGLRANASTIIDLIQQKKLLTDLLTPNPSIAALWEPSWAPTSITTDPDVSPTPPDYYTRTGFNFIHGLADFHIEWTDGRRVDPDNGDNRTRWFGLRPDASYDPVPWKTASVENLPYIPVRRQDVPLDADTTAEEIAVFQNMIEWSDPDSDSSDPQAAYRAIWRKDTWQYRPKALRFTYRLYDPALRLGYQGTADLDEDGIPDENSSGDPCLMKRYGEEFSVVIQIP